MCLKSHVSLDLSLLYRVVRMGTHDLSLLDVNRTATLWCTLSERGSLKHNSQIRTSGSRGSRGPLARHNSLVREDERWFTSAQVEEESG